MTRERVRSARRGLALVALVFLVFCGAEALLGVRYWWVLPGIMVAFSVAQRWAFLGNRRFGQVVGLLPPDTSEADDRLS